MGHDIFDRALQHLQTVSHNLAIYKFISFESTKRYVCDD